MEKKQKPFYNFYNNEGDFENQRQDFGLYLIQVEKPIYFVLDLETLLILEREKSLYYYYVVLLTLILNKFMYILC